MARGQRSDRFFFARERLVPPPLKPLTGNPFKGHWYQALLVQAATILHVGKREAETAYYYDELVTLLDIYAYSNADEKERERYARHAVRQKVKDGEGITRAELKYASLFK